MVVAEVERGDSRPGQPEGRGRWRQRPRGLDGVRRGARSQRGGEVGGDRRAPPEERGDRKQQGGDAVGGRGPLGHERVAGEPVAVGILEALVERHVAGEQQRDVGRLAREERHLQLRRPLRRHADRPELPAQPVAGRLDGDQPAAFHHRGQQHLSVPARQLALAAHPHARPFHGDALRGEHPYPQRAQPRLEGERLMGDAVAAGQRQQHPPPPAAHGQVPAHFVRRYAQLEGMRGLVGTAPLNAA